MSLEQHSRTLSGSIISSQKGFSLIELMVVVAIMAILVTIAVPNFQRFQMKAKQQEAKSNLTALYTAQKAFHAEWSQYYGDFRDIGYNPEGNLRYRISNGAGGVNSPPAAVYSFSGGAGADAAPVLFSSLLYCANTVVGVNCTDVGTYARNPTNMVPPQANNFTASAASNLDGDPVIDNWTIDQTKTFRNTQSDL